MVDKILFLQMCPFMNKENGVKSCLVGWVRCGEMLNSISVGFFERKLIFDIYHSLLGSTTSIEEVINFAEVEPCDMKCVCVYIYILSCD